MEIFHKCRTHIPIFSLLVFLLHFSSLHFLSLADDYFINCGSDDPVSLTTGYNFVGESKSGSSFSKSKAIKDKDTISPLYQTARASSKPFYYKFNITEDGTYLVRLHFLAFSSSSNNINLSTAVFNVSDSRNFSLLNNFTAKNITNSPVIKEFFLRIVGIGSLKLYFTPQASTLAFVNAIEFFLAPSDFTPENYTSNLPLNTIYRVNVGGPKLTPENDTRWRNWETDDSYLHDPNSALKRIQGAVKRNYYGEIDGLVASNDSVAPDWVYQTAKAMNTSRPVNSSNITWSFSVSRNARHIVRAHFCDITGAAPGNIVFNLYSNGNFRKEIGSWNNTISQHPGLPFYYDFMVNPSESEFINISIRPNMTDATDTNAFLNGLEILEIMEGCTVG